MEDEANFSFIVCATFHDIDIQKKKKITSYVIRLQMNQLEQEATTLEVLLETGRTPSEVKSGKNERRWGLKTKTRTGFDPEPESRLVKGFCGVGGWRTTCGHSTPQKLETLPSAAGGGLPGSRRCRPCLQT